MPPITAVAAASIALTCLIAERGLVCNSALRQIAPQPRELARLLVGFELLACAIAAIAWLIAPAAPRVLPIVIGMTGALLAGVLLLRQHHAGHIRSAMAWLISLAVLAVFPAATVAENAPTWLAAGLLTALALALGLPAFAVLAQRLDDSDVPPTMRPLLARVLVTGILALGITGSLLW